jgi:plastocyanin
MLVAAAASSSCGDGSPGYPSPVSPSAAPGARLLVGPSDYHETPTPPPGHDDPVPTPAAMTINIVGTAGPGAFAPNPLQASMGNAVVWTNQDAIVHRIVLDDGTNVGTIAPGESSAPITVSAASVTYRCTLHPSMVGTIQDASVAAPGPAPAPPPDYYPPDDDDDNGYYSRR